MQTDQATRLKVLRGTSKTQLQLSVDSFYLDREASGCTAATMIWYNKYVGALVDYLSERGVTELGQITPTHLRAWLVSLQGRELSGRTIHHHASTARAFLNFCVAEELLTASPMRKVKMPPMPKDILPAFSHEDIEKLLRECRTARDTAMIYFLLDTGCRAAEFCKLTVGDVDVGDGTVTIRQGKGKKDRVALMGKRSRKALLKYLATRVERKPDDPLWMTEAGDGALGDWGLRTFLKRLGRRAGVDHCSPHTFRRSFALWSLDAGMDIASLARIMGHADLQVLLRYLNQQKTHLQKAHREHGPVDHLL